MGGRCVKYAFFEIARRSIASYFANARGANLGDSLG